MKKFEIVYAKQFRKDVRRLHRSGYDRKKLEHIIDMLAEGAKLPERHRNHHLKGEWAHAEECHIESDWLLIYERHERELVMVMIRTGTHAQLFGK